MLRARTLLIVAVLGLELACRPGELTTDFGEADMDASVTPQPDGELPGEAGGKPREARVVDLRRDTTVPRGKPCGFKTGTNKDVLAGTNTGFTIGGKARKFLVLKVNVPAGYTGKLPVVFVWHGYGSKAENVDGGTWASSQNKPFLKVVPQAVDNQSWPMWDFKTNPGDSADIKLFDEMLVCLNAEFAVDNDRIHSVGSSMGAIFTAYLFTHRGDKLASFATVSGGFVTPWTFCSWPYSTLVPKLTPKAAALIVWGGTSDQAASWNFDTASKTMIQTLRTNTHFVVRCDHGQGHEWPEEAVGVTDINPYLYRFFEDHPRGVKPDPYQGGLPSSTPWGAWPSYCSVAP